MGLLSRLFSRAEKRTVMPLAMASIGDVGGFREVFGFDPLQDAAGQAVAERCRALISQLTASVPLLVYRRLPNGGREEDPDHPLYRLLNEESSEGTPAFEFRETMARDCAATGNALARIHWSPRGEVLGLAWIPWRNVTMEPLPTGRWRYRVTDHLGQQDVLLRSEVLHLKYASKDGITGTDPLSWARASTQLVAEQAGLARDQARRGLVADTVFETKDAFATAEAGEAAFRRLKEQLRAATARMRGGGDPILLEAGLTAKSIATSGREAQFHEARLEGLSDLCRAFGIPTAVIGLSRVASYGSLEAEGRALLQNAIGPWARRIEAALTIALLSPDSRRGVELEHDLSGLARGDLAARFDAWSKGITAGWVSPNEARRWEGLNPVQGGDEVLRPMNMQPAAAASDDQEVVTATKPNGHAAEGEPGAATA